MKVNKDRTIFSNLYFIHYTFADGLAINLPIVNLSLDFKG